MAKFFIARTAAVIAVPAVLSVLLLATDASAKATVLYSFTGGADGGQPQGRLQLDKKGNFYGTTFFGGEFGSGAVFKLSQKGKETIIHSFSGEDDGRFPAAGLTADGKGNFFGTTSDGGPYGGGTAFKISADGSESVVHSFVGPDDVGFPESDLLIDKDGNLYGTGNSGGQYSEGGVFKVTPDGNETVLYSFGGGKEGGFPVGGVAMDKAGKIYVSTCCDSHGAISRLKPDGTRTVLHSFTGGGDGSHPLGDLLLYNKDVYGTTSEGGAKGIGTVFKVTLEKEETILHTFTGGSDEGYPAAGLLADKNGNFYGTTEGADSPGTVFEIDASGNYSILHTFNGSDGFGPVAALIMDDTGNLYGTTQAGGAFNKGTVFKISR